MMRKFLLYILTVLIAATVVAAQIDMVEHCRHAEAQSQTNQSAGDCCEDSHHNQKNNNDEQSQNCQTGSCIFYFQSLNHEIDYNEITLCAVSYDTPSYIFHFPTPFIPHIDHPPES